MGRTRELEVLLVGPLPPPPGGVSTHVWRLARRLREMGVGVGVANHFGGDETDENVVGELRRNPLRYLGVLSRLDAEVVHFHYSRPSTLLAAAAALPPRRGRALVMTVHGHALVRSLGRRWAPLRRPLRRAIRSCDEVVAVSEEIAAAIAAAVEGVRPTVVPAFIPPSAEEEAGPLSPSARAFLDRPGPLLAVAASGVRFNSGAAADDYGLDVAAAVFAELAGRHRELRFAIFLAAPVRGRREARYLRELEESLVAAGRERSAILVGEPLPRAFRQGTVFLRPTRLDGDASSVREAAAAGVPAVVSDAAERPESALVVPLEDRAGWVDAVERCLEAPFGVASVSENDLEPLRAILDLYRRHAGPRLAAALRE